MRQGSSPSSTVSTFPRAYSGQLAHPHSGHRISLLEAWPKTYESGLLVERRTAPKHNEQEQLDWDPHQYPCLVSANQQAASSTTMMLLGQRRSTRETRFVLSLLRLPRGWLGGLFQWRAGIPTCLAYKLNHLHVERIMNRDQKCLELSPDAPGARGGN